MDKIEYGDVNKFLASIGLVLISLSVAAPYFYLKEDFGLYIESDKIKSFTPAIQLLVFEKQTAAAFVQKNILWASLCLFLSGITIVVIGLIRWFKRQAKVDRKEDIDLEISEWELNKLTDKERTQKVKDEIKSNEIAELKENKKLEIPPPGEVSNYLLVEQRVIDHIKKYRSDNFEVYDNIKLGDKTRIDVLLVAQTKKFADRIVEIKFTTRPITFELISDGLQKLDKYINDYLRIKKRKAVPVLLIVFPDKAPLDDTKLRELAQRAHGEASEYSTLGRLHPHFIKESEIENFDIREILSR